MPKLVIDNISVEVAEGVSVLEAAQSVGIAIPHFCWHPALGKAGACRVCAVKMVDGPVKGIQMSCMLPAQDGMVVSTTDPEAMAMRRQVIEWLMINHPHDCPVCDEGGECQLQDFTIAGGHGLRRYTGKKRTHINQYLGTNIEHEMNRCIQCYRCVRFYQEYAGGTDFGVMGSAGRVYYGRVEDGELESPFSGNLVDICPTGVFTDKTARFRARYWDYDMAPSVCPHCSLGCNITPAARYRELLKIIARRNDMVNGWFICDRGRFTDSAVNAPERPRYPMVDGRRLDWQEGISTLVSRLNGNRGKSLALVGSSRLAMETALLLPKLAKMTGAASLCYFSNQKEASQSMASLDHLPVAASMLEVQAADLVVIADCDLLTEGPMMALAIRQAWRNGAAIHVVVGSNSSGELKKLPFPWSIADTLAEIDFSRAEHPVLVCGMGYNPQDIANARRQGAKIACLLDGPNSCGVALLALEHGTMSLEQAVAEGTVKSIISIEADLPENVLHNVTVVAALDWRDTPTVRAAGIVLPTTSWVEMDGTYLNYEGRAQRFHKVMQPGLPIMGLDPARHPPRIHSAMAPGGEPRPAYQVVAETIQRLGATGKIEPFAGRWADLKELSPDSGKLVMKS